MLLANGGLVKVFVFIWYIPDGWKILFRWVISRKILHEVFVRLNFVN